MSRKIYDIIPPRVAESMAFKNKKPNFFALMAVVIVFMGLIALGALVFFSFLNSEAEIDLWPKTEKVNAQDSFTLDSSQKNLDLQNKIIPVLILENQAYLEKEFMASGKAQEEKRAAGKITVYNEYSEAPRILVPSRFISPEGKVFRSLEKITIPGRTKDSKGKIIPGQAEINVEAEFPGKDYNLGPTTFALPALAGSPLYTAIYAKSSSPMAGGNIGEVAQITEQDLQLAQKQLLEEAEEINKNAILKKLLPDMVLPDRATASEILSQQNSSSAGDTAESFKSRISLLSKAYIIKKNDLSKIINLELNPQSDEALDENALKVEYSFQMPPGSAAVLKISIAGIKYKKIDTESLKKALSGKPSKEAEMFLNELPGISKAEFRIKPFLQNSFPENISNIKVLTIF